MVSTKLLEILFGQMAERVQVDVLLRKTDRKPTETVTIEP